MTQMTELIQLFTKTPISGESQRPFDTGHLYKFIMVNLMNPNSYFDNTIDVKIDVLIDGGSGFRAGMGDAQPA